MIDAEIVELQAQIKKLEDEIALKLKELRKDPRATAISHLMYAAQLMQKPACFVPHTYLELVKALKLSYTYSAEEIMIHVPAGGNLPICHSCARSLGG